MVSKAALILTTMMILCYVSNATPIDPSSKNKLTDAVVPEDLAELETASSSNPWRMIPHGPGAPVRCADVGKLQCASHDGRSCFWGHYPMSAAYNEATGVSSSRPLTINCPGWGTSDGSNACEELGCYGINPNPNPWRMIPHGPGAPVRCARGGKLQCASNDGSNCKWGQFHMSAPYSVAPGSVKSSRPLTVNCPGWGTSDGSNACEELKCNPWRMIPHGPGAPVRCAGVGKLQCASDDGSNCKWGQYPMSAAYSEATGVTSNRPLTINCPGWGTSDGSNACAKLNC